MVCRAVTLSPRSSGAPVPAEATRTMPPSAWCASSEWRRKCDNAPCSTLDATSRSRRRTGPAFVNASRTSWPASCRSHTMTPRGWRNTPSASLPNCSPVRGLAAPPPPTSRPWMSAPWPCCTPAWSASSRWPCGPWINLACAPSTTTNRCAPKGTCLSPSSPTSWC